MRLTIEQKKKQYRTIYEAIWEDPRIFVKDLSLLLNCTPTAASNRLNEAYGCGYIMGPDVRKKSYKNLKEYFYFINSKHPELLYLKYREDPNIIYHAKTSGFCNIWIVAKEKMDIEGEIILEGYRSDYHTSYAPDHTWETALEIMQEKLADSDPKIYQSLKTIKTHLNGIIAWNSEDEVLYKYFKYNLRSNLEPIMKKHQISAEKVYRFLNRVHLTCTVATHYYPDSLPMYNYYLFMFETDYEDFIINLFSELSSSVSFFKVSNRLFASIHVPQQVMRNQDLKVAPKRSYIPLLLIDLLERGIIKFKDYSIVEYFWAKDL